MEFNYLPLSSRVTTPGNVRNREDSVSILYLPLGDFVAKLIQKRNSLHGMKAEVSANEFNQE